MSRSAAQDAAQDADLAGSAGWAGTRGVPRPPRPATQLAVYAAMAAITVLGLAIRLPLGHWSWTGDAHLHTLQEVVSVVLALGVATIALVRFHSRPSDAFLLLGTTFAGTAVLDTYHAVVTATDLSDRFPGAEHTVGSWSWLASRLLLAVGLLAVCLRPPDARRIRDERWVYAAVAVLTIGAAAVFTWAPLPEAFGGGRLAQPFELLPGLLFAAALGVALGRGLWRQTGFECWLVLSLLLAVLGQLVYAPFSQAPYDALHTAAHGLKSLSYLAALLGLISSMAALFAQAEQSAGELARVNRALQGEIADRARAEQDRDRFFGLSLDMLSIASFDGYFLELNPAWEKSLGFSLEELRARPYVDFVHPEDRSVTQDEAQRLRLGASTLQFENRYLCRDGSYKWLSWRAIALPEEGKIYGIARDESERKKVEQLKSDFISIVSHELRTPLTSIRGSLGLVAGGVAGELPEKARGLLDIAVKNSERLARLINDILDIEKVESGTMAFRIVPLDLSALVEQAIESNQAYAQQHEVRLQQIAAEPGVQVLADADRLLQVLTNLLSNAAKYSPRGGAVEVSVGRRDGRVEVAVRDRGKGIPESFQPRIFGKFAQADASSTRQKGGTGLGLSISKAIVERHGGRIWFTTREGQGTTFTFDLPEWGAAPVAAPAAPRLLVCEDDVDVAQLLALLLRQEGYRVDIAHSAAEARRRLATDDYAAMTLDLALPDEDGIELFRALRQEERTRQLPVVVVSVRAAQERLELNGGALGVIDWLVKPIAPVELTAAVERAVSWSHGAARILHVEDDPDLLRVVAEIVGPGAQVVPARSLQEARDQLAQAVFDLVVLDLALPDGSGLELLPALGSRTPPVPVLVFSAHELGEALGGRVASVLIKSQTSNVQLLGAIQRILAGAPPAA